jgi:peptide/nickel transport system permease protein
MRLVDIVMTLPALPLLIVIAAFVKPSIFIVAFIIALLGWAGMARVIRSNILSIKESSFVEVALMSGVPKHKIMFVDLLKHVLPLVLAYSLFAVIGAILTEASLDFIGVGPVTDYSWGAMIAYAQENGAIFVKAWWWFLPPGISIAILSTGFGLIAYGMESFYNRTI